MCNQPLYFLAIPRKGLHPEAQSLLNEAILCLSRFSTASFSRRQHERGGFTGIIVHSLATAVSTLNEKPVQDETPRVPLLKSCHACNEFVIAPFVGDLELRWPQRGFLACNPCLAVLASPDWLQRMFGASASAKPYASSLFQSLMGKKSQLRGVYPDNDR